MSSSLRLLLFVLLGAAGFGVGFAMVPITGLLGQLAAGALGGVALGVAWRDMRTAVALGLASAVGFGIGSFTSFFIMLGSETMESLVSRWVFLGVVAGVVGGAALGLALWSLALLDWKVIVTLALVGALGFGIGGGVADILRHSFVELRPGVSVLWPTLYSGIQGAIGGAALGAALGLLKRRQNLDEQPPRVRPTHSPRTPWYRRRSLLVLAGLLTLLVLGYAGWPVVKEGTGVGGCSSGERAVLEEFPHYSDQRLRIYFGLDSCNARYTPVATRSEVLGYYDERLHENGWEVGGYWAANPPQGIEVFGEKVSDLEEAPEEGVRSGLEARRDEYTYSVEYYPPGSPAVSAEGGGSENEAMVIVAVTDDQGAGGKVKGKVK